jgi:hypothetical protein
MDAILTLLDRYGLVDPAAGMGVGVFADPDLQALYDQLMVEGRQSLENALGVGATIEEIDILDLEGYLAQTDNSDIQQVYQNLKQGSENHLRAFVNALEAQGEDYQPQHLSQEAFDTIMSGSTGNSAGRGSQGGGRRNGQG